MITVVNLFCLSGQIDSWKEYFTAAQNEEFDRIYEDELKGFDDLKAKIQFE